MIQLTIKTLKKFTISLTRKMKVFLKGGLGNQLFQFAFAFYFADKKIENIVFDISLLEYNKSKNTKRDFALHFIGLPYERSLYSVFYIYVISKIEKIFRTDILISDRNFHKIPEYFNDSKICGYFQSDINYLNKIELDLIQFLNQKIKNSIIDKKLIKIKKNSVSIHIRRGDYISNKAANMVHCVMDETYYLSAIGNFRNENVHFYIFTDDVEWVNSVLLKKSYINYTILSELGYTDLEELYLMSKCENNIISNSTFSWWAAYININESKIVVSPKKWFHNDGAYPRIKNAIYI